MASKGPYTTMSFRIDRFDGDYCYYAFPERVRVNVQTGAIEVIALVGPNKGNYVPAKLNRSGAKMPFRISLQGRSYSAARLIYMAHHPLDINSSKPVQFKDANSSNLNPDNLYLGSMGVTRSIHAGTYNPEWNKLVESLIPDPRQRNVRNPVYMKLLNSKVGSDGLNHIQRYKKRRHERKLLERSELINETPKP